MNLQGWERSFNLQLPGEDREDLYNKMKIKWLKMNLFTTSE
jgi:hypothetical protein